MRDSTDFESPDRREFLKITGAAIGGAVLRPRCACIEDPVVIRKILNHLQEQSPLDSGVPIPSSRAPPQALLFS